MRSKYWWQGILSWGQCIYRKGKYVKGISIKRLYIGIFRPMVRVTWYNCRVIMISMSMVREYINGSVYHWLDIRSIVRPHKGANIIFVNRGIYIWLVIQRDYHIHVKESVMVTMLLVRNFLLLMQFFTK